MMLQPLDPAETFRCRVGASTLRETLAALVRRRIPQPDVEDVVQSALCDALATAQPPDEAHALTRWIVGIARHKIADFYRRTRREVPGDLADSEAPPTSFEAREALRGFLDDARDERAHETFRWLLREADGEALVDLAREAQLPAPTVRQRVFRLRRELRARWLLHTAALLVAMVALRSLHRAADVRPELVAEPMAPPETPGQAQHRLSGAWEIVAITPASSLDARRRTVAEAAAHVTWVDVTGSQIVVQSPAFRLEGRIEVLRVHGATADAVLRDGHGQRIDARVRFAADGRVGITAASGVWSGAVMLARRPER